jgi:hypothetical protein
MQHAWERGEMRKKFWSENLKGKRPLGRSRRRWEDNIRTDLTEIKWKGMDWIHLAHDRQQW